MFQRISNGWQLAKSSWEVLKLDKELLIFPLLSGLACLLVLASFAIPLMNSPYVHTVSEERTAPQDPIAYVILFLFYFCNYFVIVFFNAALVGCAIMRFRGEDPTLGDGFRIAMSRLPQIFAWALVSATVGMVLRLIESRSERAGRFVAGLLGMAWGAVTFLVVPVLVVERLGPFAAVSRSLSLLRRAWGEALVSNVGIGLIVFLGVLVAMVPAVLGFLSGSVAGVIAGITTTVVLILLISLVSSALHAIVLAAVYEYAAEETVPDAFDATALRSAFVAK